MQDGGLNSNPGRSSTATGLRPTGRVEQSTVTEANHLGAHQSNLDCLPLLLPGLIGFCAAGGSPGARDRDRDRQPLDWSRRGRRGYKRSFVYSFLQRIAYGLPVATLTAYGLHVAWVVAQTETESTACLPRGWGCLTLYRRSVSPRGAPKTQDVRSGSCFTVCFYSSLGAAVANKDSSEMKWSDHGILYTTRSISVDILRINKSKKKVRLNVHPNAQESDSKTRDNTKGTDKQKHMRALNKYLLELRRGILCPSPEPYGVTRWSLMAIVTW